MPLQRQVVTVPLRGGIDAKSDPKQIPTGKLASLENAVFTSPGMLRKRNGYSALTNAISNPPNINAPNITAGQALMPYLSELIACDPSRIYSFNSATPSWTYKGDVVSPYITQQQVVRNGYGQSGQDGSTHTGTGMQCYAWEDTSGGVRYSIIDGTSGQAVVASQLLSTTGIKPKVLCLGNTFVILYVNRADWRIYEGLVQVATPSTPVVPIPLTPVAGSATLSSSLPNFDACLIPVGSDTQMYLAFSNTGNGTSVYNFASSDPTNPLITTSYAEVAQCLSIFGDPSLQAPVIISYNGTAVRYHAFAQWPSPGVAPSVIAYNTIEILSNVVSVAGVATSSSAVGWSVYYTVSAPSPSDYQIRQATFVGNYTPLPAPYLRSVGLAGKPYVYGGSAFVPMAHQSKLQSTYFIADSSGNIVVRALPGLGGGIPTRSDGHGAAMLPET
jgi:hypothetical protein